MTGSSPLTRGKHTCNGCSDLMRGIIPAHAGKTPSLPSRTSPTRDHPRSRGENDEFARVDPRAVGSSPLTRGKRSWLRPGIASGGIIPAHAGKTVLATPRYRFRRDHPRSRGENCDVLSLQAYYPGSSPLTRGKLYFNSALRATRGIIPAHAGKTYTCIDYLLCNWDHPRSRGENSSRRLKT